MRDYITEDIFGFHNPPKPPCSTRSTLTLSPRRFERPAAARLAFRYNAQRTLHWFTHPKAPGYWRAVQPVAVLHFSSSPKPWEAPGKKGELELVWWKFFMQSQLGASLGPAAAALANFC
jgi:hypothetical protein